MFELQQRSRADEAALEERSVGAKRRRVQWVLLVAALAPAFWFFVWAGSGAVGKNGSGGQRGLTMWQWPEAGLALTPGLVWIWISAGLLFLLLSLMAYLLATTPMDAWKLPPAFSGPLILAVAALVRVYVYQRWTPGLDAGLARDGLQNAGMWHAGLVAADLGVIALLMAGLWYQERSVWWAALYAWHPLPLLEIAGNTHFAPLGLGFLAALLVVGDPPREIPRAIRLSRVRATGTVRWILTPIFALGALAGMAAAVAPGWLPASWGMGLVHERFNALLPLAVERLAFPDDAQRAARCVMAILLVAEGAVVGLAVWRRWPLGRTLAHGFIIFLLCWPRVYPWYALWPLVASILARGTWNRAAWVLSGTVLAAYSVHYAGTVRGGQVPMWVLVLEWLPVAVVEMQQLASDAWGRREGAVAAAVVAA